MGAYLAIKGGSLLGGQESVLEDKGSTKNGITMKRLADGGIKLTGKSTQTSGYSRWFLYHVSLLRFDVQSMSFYAYGKTNPKIHFILGDGDYSYKSTSVGATAPANISRTGTGKVFNYFLLDVDFGEDFGEDGVIIYPMLAEGTYTTLAEMPAYTYEPYYTYKKVKALTVSGNKFEINGEHAKNSASISIDGDKIINKAVAGGNYELINYKKTYPAGTYRICASVDTTDNSKTYRPVIKTTTAISGMSYLALYGGYWKDIASGESFTFTANAEFSLGFVFGIVTAGTAKTYYDISLKRIGQRCTIRMRPTTSPEQYQRVEYIESTGTQYIDTGVIGKSPITAEMKMRWNALQKDGAFLGSRTNVDGAKRIYMCYMYNPNFETEQVGRWYIGYNVLKDTGIAIEKGRDYELKTILKNAKQEFYIDGERVWYEYVGGEVNTGLNLYLFNYNQDNSIISYCASSARLYYLTIYDGDKLVRNFIPCYRKSDGEIGLLDIVSGVFYTNQGTGTFKKGANV